MKRDVFFKKVLIFCQNGISCNMWNEVTIEDVPRLTRLPLQVKCLGATHGGTYPERTIRPNKLEICFRLYSKKKEGVNYIDGVRYLTHFPHVQIKYPRMEHRFEIDVPLESFYFAYAKDMEDRLREVLPLPSVPIWEIELGERESRLIAELMELMLHSRDYGAADRIDILSLELLEQVVFQFNLNAAHPGYHESKIRAIASYIQFHFRKDIDFDSVAQHHGISRSTLERHWRKYYQMTPGEYVRNQRIREACRLLRENPRIRINEVSRGLNFRDDAYFCALFRKQVGMTPVAWRDGK